MRETRAAAHFIARHHVQRQRVVRDGLLRENETFLRQRSPRPYDWGEERGSAKYVRPDDVDDSLYSSFSPLIRAGEHLAEYGLKHNADHAVVF